MENGPVKWFTERKGFGFIEREGAERDLVVRQAEGGGNSRDGAEVEFDIGGSEKGPNAAEVKRVE